MLAPTPLPQSSVTPRSTSPAATDLPKGMNKVGLIVHDVERMRAEVDDLIPGTSQLRGSFFSADPQWSEAMPTRNLRSFLG